MAHGLVAVERSIAHGGGWAGRSGDRVLRPILVALASSALGAAEGLGSAAAIEAAGPLLACGEARRTNGKESRNYS